MLRSLPLMLVLAGLLLGSAATAYADEPSPPPAAEEPTPPPATKPDAPSKPAGVRNWGQAGAVPPAPTQGPELEVSRPDPELSKAPIASRGPLVPTIDATRLPPPSIRGRPNAAAPTPVPTPSIPPIAPRREPIVVAPPPVSPEPDLPRAPAGALEDTPAIESFPAPAPPPEFVEPPPPADDIGQPDVAPDVAPEAPPAPAEESFLGNRIDSIQKTHNLQTNAGDLALRLDIRFTTRNQRGREVFVAMWFIDRRSGQRLISADPAFSDVKGKLTAQSQAAPVPSDATAFDSTLIVPYRAFPQLGNLPTYEIDAQCLLLRREEGGMVRVLATGNTMFRVYGSNKATDPDSPRAKDWSDPVPTEFLDKPAPNLPVDEEDDFSDPSAPEPMDPIKPPEKAK